ncbi:hypothetical protein CLOSTASPAR_01053 [[Clostridium] asparagiforme DSM 15981]|uniref:Uncharacterized protein n=1 Tax=[Clostridium] asparagiforme DSM 15981 TaxID=518636 RepID=C0CVQ0_9FIRM|nr:hypothetical protein CLOSTASPAR_01053 [[Clostridium] asparagiforme DSM 15981]
MFRLVMQLDAPLEQEDMFLQYVSSCEDCLKCILETILIVIEAHMVIKALTKKDIK